MSLAEQHCTNCESLLTGPFCHFCGQRQDDLRRGYWQLIGEAFDNLFHPGSPIARSLGLLIARPGALTAEYLAGKRARSIPPVRLYFITSITFFFLASAANNFSVTAPIEQTVANDPSDWTEVEEAANSVNIDWLSEEMNALVRQHLSRQLEKLQLLVASGEGEGAAVSKVLDLAPPIVFLLLPLFALLLKLTYLRQGVYYVEHLVFALHNHAFLFVNALVRLAAGELADTPLETAADWFQTGVSFYTIAYMYLSLKRVYQQSHAITALKFVFLGFAYVQIFLLAVAVGLLWGFMTL